MVSTSRLVGYIRKMNEGRAIRLSIDKTAFDEAQTFKGSDGREFVQLVADIPKIEEIIAGEREVTSLCQIVDE